MCQLLAFLSSLFFCFLFPFPFLFARRLRHKNKPKKSKLNREKDRMCAVICTGLLQKSFANFILLYITFCCCCTYIFFSFATLFRKSHKFIMIFPNSESFDAQLASKYSLMTSLTRVDALYFSLSSFLFCFVLSLYVSLKFRRRDKFTVTTATATTTSRKFLKENEKETCCQMFLKFND